MRKVFLLLGPDAFAGLDHFGDPTRCVMTLEPGAVNAFAWSGRPARSVRFARGLAHVTPGDELAYRVGLDLAAPGETFDGPAADFAALFGPSPELFDEPPGPPGNRGRAL